jgi:AbrB family looped-hinge helix DNA binding protein
MLVVNPLGVPMATAKVTSRGQITIPAQIRASLGLKPGDSVEFLEFEVGQFSMMAATHSVKGLKGMIRKPETAVSIEEMNVAIADQGRPRVSREEVTRIG